MDSFQKSENISNEDITIACHTKQRSAQNGEEKANKTLLLVKNNETGNEKKKVFLLKKTLEQKTRRTKQSRSEVFVNF